MANFSIISRSSNGVFYYAQDSMTVWDYLVIMEMQQAGASSYFTIQMANVPNFPQLYFRFYGNFSFITQQNTEGQLIPYIQQGSIVNRIDVIDQTGKIYSQVTGVELQLTMNKTTRQLEPNDFFATAIRPNEVISPDNLFQFADSLFGSAGIETLNGYAGNDTIDGGAGADRLIGGIGADLFRIRAGDAPAGESIDGGEGIDVIEAVGVAATQNLLQQGRINLSGLSFNSIEELHTNGTEVELPTFFFVGSGGMQTVRGKIGSTDVVTFTNASNANFETLGFADWTSGQDLVGIVGSPAAESIFGTGFDDAIVGGLGADSLRGNGGNDRFIILAGQGGLADSIDGGIGNDTLQADGGTGTTDLRLSTLTSIETLNVVTGTIQISAREINGGAIIGSSTLISGKIGTITGSSAPGLIRSGTVDVFLDSGMQGADYTNLSFTNWNDYGISDGSFRVFGVAQTQAVLGMANEENWIVLNLAAQSTFIRGGAQFDYLVGGNFADWIDAGDSYDYVIALGGDDSVDLGGGDDYALAGAGNDAVGGGAGNDTIFGEAGNDTLIGGAGADSLDGGDGAADLVSYSTATAGVRVDLAAPATNLGEAAGDTISGIEGVIGSAYNDTLRGDALANGLYGLNGDDTLEGMGGADIILGGDGLDTLTGGADNDTLDGGAGTDTASFADRALDVALNPFLNVAVIGGTEFDTILNIENFTGGGGNDTLQGTLGVNVIAGGGGNDLIYAFDGNDTVDGGAGNDVIAAGIGNDTVTGGDGGDWVYGEDGNDQVSGTAKSGGAFDVLIGGLGDDTLEGSANGFDYFYGGVGVNGGTGDGNDSYIVRGNTGIKVMNDFEVGGTADVVRILGTGLANFAQAQAAMSFSGVINGTVLVVDGTTQIWFLNGTQPANLTAADFLFV